MRLRACLTIFAALMPLPAAPVATDSAATDVGNLILYQSSLASYDRVTSAIARILKPA